MGHFKDQSDTPFNMDKFINRKENGRTSYRTTINNLTSDLNCDIDFGDRNIKRGTRDSIKK